MPVKVCVLGHSFVSGLLHHLSAGGGSNPSPTQIAKQLKLDKLISEFHLIGERGAKILNSNFALPPLHFIQPDIIILQYGSNDLAAGSPPLSVATRIVDIAHLLLRKYPSIKAVVVLSILPRTNIIQLNDNIFKCNGFLDNYCEVESKIHYKALQGFWDKPISAWSRDSIHPNSRHGRTTYKNNLRRVIFATLPKLNKL